MFAPRRPVLNQSRSRAVRLTAAATLALTAQAALASQLTPEPPMMRSDTPATDSGWSIFPIFTVSETISGYQPAGIPDGMAAFPLDEATVRVFMNHELPKGNGYAYTLATGTALTGSRVSFFDINRTTKAIENAGPAYDTVYDRTGAIVTAAAQINEVGHATQGFDRFCSGTGVQAGTYGFVDDIYFTDEESGTPGHPHGGSVWALRVGSSELWAVPQLGRGAWENVTPIQSPDPQRMVALLLGNDIAGSPLYFYYGFKNVVGDGSFLDRNGLKVGQLYAWKADNGDTSPQQFHGRGASRVGTFVPVAVRDPLHAGQPGYDQFGYLNDTTLITAATSQGAFTFSRPEDLHVNPSNGLQVVFASTGRGDLFPADNWGDVYVIQMDFSVRRRVKATLTIIHDADSLPIPDMGIRSPDNVTWAGNGFVYAQEDRATTPASLFGGVSGVEASIWQIDPVSGSTTRIAEMDRSVVVPAGTTDSGVGQIGHWEASGVIDVTDLFVTAEGETLLLANVQAHGITNGPIGGAANLVEGGQLIFLSNNSSDGR